MSILCCGPFARVGHPDDRDCTCIRIPIRTQGDFVRTEEGYEAMEGAIATLSLAVERGELPYSTVFELKNDDNATIVISYDTIAAALANSPRIKKLIPALTKAAIVNPTMER